MNAIDLLKKDHETVKHLLAQISATNDTSAKKRTELLDKIEMELTVHTALEEEILYPAFKQAGKKQEEKMYFEAKEEHRTVDSMVLPDLKKTKPDSVEFSGRVKVLKELIEHHIEEEETEMFPDALNILGKRHLEELGVQMQTRQKELKASLQRKAA
ncbi:hemerythrin domain-containing protein [Pseudomonas sp. PDNC002]|uniref:hemerythrin domain-containing protein n=1 Tax=Pseudomonas sp. PDNC002 TaxID=2811422 RepID=UPI0019647CC0|nr:hemerythrin domain-containing protein [Pseudomonas sp. PDNC002]QRY79353.1 hemerythrin domain-containing protein [Pseudomonas sp. PDNC002]